MASPRATRRQRPSHLTGAEEIDGYKRDAARAAAELVRDGMRVGLGTGSTAAHLLPALVERRLGGLRCVATSQGTERAARDHGLELCSLDELGELDIAIDGADQVDPAGWLIKGGGGAHTREKIVAAAARQFVAAEKLRDALTPPVPLELLPFGAELILRALGEARLRDVPPSPDGGLIADYLGPVDDPRALALQLEAIPGVIEHGLFPPEMVSSLVIAGPAGVELRDGAKHPR
jgi:ribose 5-phosphate isomerase A